MPGIKKRKLHQVWTSVFITQGISVSFSCEDDQITCVTECVWAIHTPLGIKQLHLKSWKWVCFACLCFHGAVNYLVEHAEAFRAAQRCLAQTGEVGQGHTTEVILDMRAMPLVKSQNGTASVQGRDIKSSHNASERWYKQEVQSWLNTFFQTPG